MPKKAKESEIVYDELHKDLEEFEAKFKDRTSSPDDFMKIAEFEEMYENLLNGTKVLYDKFVHDLYSQIDEKELVAKKKRNTGQKGSD
jgi:hypothetical protein